MDFYQVCSNYALGIKKRAHPRCHMYYLGWYRVTWKIFLPKTARPKVLLFGMCHQQVEFYQVFTNNASWAKNGPALGGHLFYKGWSREKIFFSENTRSRALIFDNWHHLLDFFQESSNYTPGAKNSHTLGVTFLQFIGKNIKKSSCLKP